MLSRAIIISLLVFSLISAFTIDSYEEEVWILPNGDIQVKETMVFDLEQQFNEGYRSIRPADYEDLSNLIVEEATLNGNPVNHYTQEMNGKAEIVWTETTIGKNEIELTYTLKNRVELWDDFAKLCFEHYGANWKVPAKEFKSTTHLPKSTRNTEMHFEVYSTKQGSAYIDALSVIIDLNNVPPGNYIGGCYLFNKSAVSTTKIVEGSALEILEEEREIYGSTSMVGEQDSDTGFCCIPIFILLLILSAYFFFTGKSIPKLPESIMPPSKEEPVAVATLLHQNYKEKEILAATILELINKGVIDIMELEKKESTGMEIKRERTILFLKKPKASLKKYEKAVIDMIFQKGKKEVDLDALAKEFDSIKGKAEAKKSPIPAKMDIFTKEIEKIVKEKKLKEFKESRSNTLAVAGALAFVAAFLFFCMGIDILLNMPLQLISLFESQDYFLMLAMLVGLMGTIITLPVSIHLGLRPNVPKEWETPYSQWRAFHSAVKSSSLKEQPPSAALIWGEILVYATALGLADKVKKHFSELDSFLVKRIEKLEAVRVSSINFYTSAWAIHNLSRYGNRSGPRASGFSSGSTGGWSSGGGGFSGGGFSGGGGFR